MISVVYISPCVLAYIAGTSLWFEIYVVENVVVFARLSLYSCDLSLVCDAMPHVVGLLAYILAYIAMTYPWCKWQDRRYPSPHLLPDGKSKQLCIKKYNFFSTTHVVFQWFKSISFSFQYNSIWIFAHSDTCLECLCRDRRHYLFLVSKIHAKVTMLTL